MASIVAPWIAASQLASDDFFTGRAARILRREQRQNSHRARIGIGATSLATTETGPDLFLLDLAEKLEESVSKQEDLPGNKSLQSALSALREASSEVAVTCKWPSNKDESYRFTDVKFLRSLEISPAMAGEIPGLELELEEESDTNVRVTFVDGIYSPGLSRARDLPPGVFIGSIRDVPPEKLQRYVLPTITQQASALIDKDAFVSLNGIGALDLGVVLVPENLKLEKPIHVRYHSTGKTPWKIDRDGAITMSNPRLLLVASRGSEVHLVEEFTGAEDACYWTNSVCQISVEAGAKVWHDFVQTQSRASVSTKKSYVSQEKGSSYKCVEVELGSKLSRHNLHIEQLGPETSTEIKTFLLCGSHQLQDLHSRLVLNHPRGFANQLHKCIVIHSTGHGVFDGTIRVNRNAQQTDAGQLSRSLLLAPRATLNAKPSLQINADDVKCSHGVAISDLEEDQLFYFQARGIDAQTARSALVFSFGAEVIEQLRCPGLRDRVEGLLKTRLASEGAIQLTEIL